MSSSSNRRILTITYTFENPERNLKNSLASPREEKRVMEIAPGFLSECAAWGKRVEKS